jgi:hypothetical protein
MGSWDFASPDAVLTVALRLKKPALIFDNIKELSSLSNANAFAGLGKMERGWGSVLERIC